MSITALRMKLDAFAALSRSLRPKARKAFDHAQMLRIHERLATSGMPLRQMERVLKGARRRTAIMVRDHSSVQDGRVIIPMQKPEKQWLVAADAAARALHMDRTVYLRRELRAGNLAYAFLRGLSVESVEAKAREPVPFDKIERIVREYGAGGAGQYDNAFSAWRVDALARSTHPHETAFVKRREERAAKEAEAGYSRLMWGGQQQTAA